MTETDGRQFRRVAGHKMTRTPLGPTRPRQPVRDGWQLTCACGWSAPRPLPTRTAASRAYSAHLDDVKPVPTAMPRCAADDSRVFPIPGERWLPVPEWEGFYEISDQGRVWSNPRECTKGGLIVATQIGRGNHHLGVRLNRPGRRIMAPVHRLVMEAFVGPLPPGMQTRHGPGGWRDNRLVNLCYGTPAENQRDRERDGTDLRGEAIPWSKLTEAVVRECRRRHAVGEVQRALAREFGVNPATLHNAIVGKTWAHVAMDNEEAA